MRRFFLATLAGLVALVSSAASAGNAPHPGLLTSGSVNFAYALKNVCFAYVFDGDNDVLKAEWGVAAIGWGPQQVFRSQNMQAHLVGVAGRINVGVKTENGVRRCEIEVNQGDPNGYRAQLLQLVAERPEQFSPLKSPVAPNGFAFRDGWCGPAPSSASILASTAKPGAGVAMLVTIMQGGSRGQRCDRADIGSATSAPVPATLNLLAPGSAGALAVQRSVLSAFTDICLPGVASDDASKSLDPATWKPLSMDEKDRIARFGATPGAAPYQSIPEPHLFLADARKAHACVVFADAGDPNALFDAAKDLIGKRIEGFGLGYEDDHSAVYCREQTPQPVVLVVAKGSHRNDQFIFRIVASYIVPGKHCPPLKR